MSYPTLRGLAIEDFKNLSPETRQGLEQLLFSLNPFLADTSDLLGGRLSLANHTATLKEVSFSMPDGWVPLIPNELSSASFTVGMPWPSCRWEGREIVFRGAGAMSGDIVASGGAAYRIPAGYRPARPVRIPGYYEGTPFMWEINDEYLVMRYEGTITQEDEDLSVEGIRYPGVGPIPPLPSPFPLKVAHGLPGKPGIVLPILCLDCTGNTITPAPVPRLTWGYSEGGITIYRVDGLPDNRSYRLTVLIAS